MNLRAKTSPYQRIDGEEEGQEGRKGRGELDVQASFSSLLARLTA